MIKAVLSAALVLGLATPAAAQTAIANVTIDTAKPGAEISKHLYGQFAEHLGHGIYEGIWVGEGSKIPNIRGYRKDVVDALRKIHVPNIRWPGGCFADLYDWRDGIAARETPGAGECPLGRGDGRQQFRHPRVHEFHRSRGR